MIELGERYTEKLPKYLNILIPTIYKIIFAKAVVDKICMDDGTL